MNGHVLLVCSLMHFVTSSVMCDVVKPQVVVVSLDGLPKDQLARHPWQHLTWVYSHGSHPRTFINQFPTKTMPNHFSVATGMYPESHGVVGNTVFDPKLNRTLKVEDKEFFTQNPEVMPLWTLNELHGGHSGCIMWPGCVYSYHGINVTYMEKFRKNVKLQERVDFAVQWLTDGIKPANLIFLYHDQPDSTGHIYGPNSSYYTEELKKVDAGIGYLFQMLELRGLREKVDVIILSDHGITSVSSVNGIIDLKNIISSDLYTFTGSSPVISIWPVKGKELLVYSKLKEGSLTHPYKAYLKDDPQMKDWHYKDNQRISSITLVCDLGYVFQDFNINVYNGYPGLTNTYGDHGYEVNQTDMEPIFVATGPSFQKNVMTEPFSNLDVYPLVCEMLGLPAGPNNGSLDNIYPILAHTITTRLIQPLLAAIGCLVAIGVVAGAVACRLHRREKRKVTADALINGYVYRKTMEKNKRSTNASEQERLLDEEEVDADDFDIV